MDYWSSLKTGKREQCLALVFSEHDVTGQPEHFEQLHGLIVYFGESDLGAVRIGDFKYRFIDQPGGWVGPKIHLDMPILTNLRLDPFERTGWPRSGTKEGGQQYFDWFKYEFWRFVFVQQQVEKLAATAIAFPPMQEGASFNLDAVKKKLAAARAAIGK